MKKEFRIKKNEEFQAVFKQGKSFANRQLVIYYLKKPGQLHFRAGISVGKKIGNAVTRNRIKRYLRTSFQEMESDIKNEYDYVVIARGPTKEMNLKEVKKSLVHLIHKERLFKK